MGYRLGTWTEFEDKKGIKYTGKPLDISWINLSSSYVAKSWSS